MTERVEEIRRLHEYVHPIRAAADCDTCWFLSRLAQADREREAAYVELNREQIAHREERELLRAEVERLWAKVAAIIRWPNDGPVPTEDNILPALTGLLASIPAYQAEVKRWKERVTTLETEEKWEALKQAEAALARVRAALETAANRLDIAASVIRSGAEFARWADEARAALEGRG